MIAVDNPDVVRYGDKDCSLKAVFSLYVSITIAQFLMGVVDVVLFVWPKKEENNKRRECKLFKVLIHFNSGAGIVAALFIYGLGHQDKVGWAFWMAVVAGFLAISNAILWILTQQTKLYLVRAGVNVKHLEDGKMADGTDRPL